jgi:hypothetical protein
MTVTVSGNGFDEFAVSDTGKEYSFIGVGATIRKQSANHLVG